MGYPNKIWLMDWLHWLEKFKHWWKVTWLNDNSSCVEKDTKSTYTLCSYVQTMVVRAVMTRFFMITGVNCNSLVLSMWNSPELFDSQQSDSWGEEAGGSPLGCGWEAAGSVLLVMCWAFYPTLWSDCWSSVVHAVVVAKRDAGDVDGATLKVHQQLCVLQWIMLQRINTTPSLGFKWLYSTGEKRHWYETFQ